MANKINNKVEFFNALTAVLAAQKEIKPNIAKYKDEFSKRSRAAQAFTRGILPRYLRDAYTNLMDAIETNVVEMMRLSDSTLKKYLEGTRYNVATFRAAMADIIRQGEMAAATVEASDILNERNKADFLSAFDMIAAGQAAARR